MKKMLALVMVLVATMFFSGCGSDPHVYNPNTKSGLDGSGVPGGGGPINEGEGLNPDDWKKTGTGGVDAIPGDPRGTPVEHPFKTSPVYFAFDSAQVGEAYDNLLKAVADYMNAHPTYHLTIEGHCDERGSDEYNRALSERRALAVKEILIRNGAPESRINTVGYGEEKPAATGSTLDVFAKNRRAEFAVFAK